MPSTAQRTLLASSPPVVVVWLVAALIAGRSVTTSAANWNIQEGIRVQSTITDNVRLQPEDQATSDLIVEVAPYIRLSGDGDRLKVNFAYAPNFSLYARNPEDNGINHRLNAASRAEVVENLFFFDADALVSQTFISPFGTTQGDFATINENAVETYGVRLSPYAANFGSNLAWHATTQVGLDQQFICGTRHASWLASLETPVRLFCARAEYRRDDTDSEGQRTLTSEVSRAYLYYQPLTSLRLSAIGGYEHNNYSSRDTETKNVIYGAGFDWRPRSRTSVSARFEDRYFGTGYNVALNHRTRLTAWNFAFSRDASSYAQQLFALPPGNTAVLLDSLLTARIPDPAERAAAVEEILRRTGLPPFLAGPQSVYTEQVTLLESAVASFAILGVRNSHLTGFSTSQERLSDDLAVTVGDVFSTVDEFTTRGISVALAHYLSALTTITGTYLHSVSESSTTLVESTLNDYRLRWTHRLTPKTSLFSVARYVRFDSEGSGFSGYQERAVLAGFDHAF
jgi:uncharacterized protein (PEP-CTERM system associated)